MEINLKFKNFNIFEIINPKKEEILKLIKKFKIKEINIKYSLTTSHYAEFIKEKKYLNFQLIYPKILKNYVYFEKLGIFVLNKDVILIRKESPEINRIKLKAISILEKKSIDKTTNLNELFVTIFISLLVKSYFPLLRSFSKQLSKIENELEGRTPLKTISQISKLRRNLIFSQTASKSILDLINQTIKNNLPIVKNNSDLWEIMQDNINFITEKLDDYEKILEGLSKSFESRLSLQINESIKTLTIIQSIFLPAMLITSMYGMNVALPFQESKLAFLIISGIMILSTLLLILIIKKINKLINF